MRILLSRCGSKDPSNSFFGLLPFAFFLTVLGTSPLNIGQKEFHSFLSFGTASSRFYKFCHLVFTEGFTKQCGTRNNHRDSSFCSLRCHRKSLGVHFSIPLLIFGLFIFMSFLYLRNVETENSSALASCFRFTLGLLLLILNISEREKCFYSHIFEFESNISDLKMNL